MTSRSLIPVEVSGTVAPDGRPSVLLQLPDGYVIMTPEDAAKLAVTLTDVAVEVAMTDG